MTDVAATIAKLDAASSRSGHGPMAALGEDVLLRLALWLAEVAAEAALAATAPAARSTAGAPTPRRTGRAGEPPVSESAR